MAITDLIPWKKTASERQEDERALQVRQDPYSSFQQQMNRVFDDFFQGTGLAPFGASREEWDVFNPQVDVVETDKAIKLSVELPGLEEKDIDVELSQNTITISGEKRQEKEEKGQNYLHTERSYGSFRRSIPLSSKVGGNKADAVFQNGVLTITLPKVVKTQTRKKVVIKAQ